VEFFIGLACDRLRTNCCRVRAFHSQTPFEYSAEGGCCIDDTATGYLDDMNLAGESQRRAARAEVQLSFWRCPAGGGRSHESRSLTPWNRNRSPGDPGSLVGATLSSNVGRRGRWRTDMKPKGPIAEGRHLCSPAFAPEKRRKNGARGCCGEPKFHFPWVGNAGERLLQSSSACGAWLTRVIAVVTSRLFWRYGRGL